MGIESHAPAGIRLGPRRRPSSQHGIVFRVGIGGRWTLAGRVQTHSPSPRVPHYQGHALYGDEGECTYTAVRQCSDRECARHMDTRRVWNVLKSSYRQDHAPGTLLLCQTQQGTRVRIYRQPFGPLRSLPKDENRTVASTARQTGRYPTHPGCARIELLYELHYCRYSVAGGGMSVSTHGGTIARTAPRFGFRTRTTASGRRQEQGWLSASSTVDCCACLSWSSFSGPPGEQTNGRPSVRSQ